MRKKQVLIEPKSEPVLAADPWTLYLYAMRSPATKEKYLMRLTKFLGFLNLQGTLEDKARFFAEKGKYDSTWALTASSNFCKKHVVDKHFKNDSRTAESDHSNEKK